MENGDVVPSNLKQDNKPQPGVNQVFFLLHKRNYTCSITQVLNNITSILLYEQ